MLQCSELQRMSPLNRKSLDECKTKVLYRAWKGQLFIQDQQLCDIVLQSPFSISIPAQLPAKLEIRHAVVISELRKKLPDAAFRRENYSDHEVRDKDTLFFLYEVEILNQNEPKVEQLIETLKEKKLAVRSCSGIVSFRCFACICGWHLQAKCQKEAIPEHGLTAWEKNQGKYMDASRESLRLHKLEMALIKYLNDQGALILLSSSVFVKEKDADLDDPSCLQALFLISSPGPKCSTAKDWKCEHRDNERSLQVTLVLPGLHHVLLEAAKCPDREGPPPGTLVKHQIQEFAKRRKNSHSGSDTLNSPPVSFDTFLKKSDLDALSEKCHQNSFAHLQFYLLHPQNYMLEMSAAVACLDPSSQSPSSSSSHVQDPDSSPSLNMDLLPPEASETSTSPQHAAQMNLPMSNDAAAKPSQMGDRPLQWCKRRSSRLLGASARNMWSPLKALCIMENSKKRKKIKKKKKKKSPSPPSSTTPEPPPESKELTLKLKNLPNPLRRKRGAEVLSAEIVQGTRCESAIKAPSSSESLAVTEKRPRLLKPKKDEEKAQSEEQMETRRPVTRQSALRSMNEASLQAQKEVGDKNDPKGEQTTTQDAEPSEDKEECDSHALNMLADLALSSCNSPLISNGSQSPLAISPLQECCNLQSGEMLPNSSDHEYHRAMEEKRKASLSDSACQHSLSSPEEGGLSPELPSSSQERSLVSSRKKGGVRPGSAKSHTMLLRKAVDILNSNIDSQISIEHSYASPALESSKKGAPVSPDSRNGVKYMKSGPLAVPGKVLPFRHQQNICHPHKQLRNSVQFIRSAIMAARLKEDFTKSHKVVFCDRTVKVTFQREAEYLFSLDSKYTNNSLEKTVIRAVHGPWDVSQSDDFEEMRLILHMWVALFYSKPFKASTERKVVEHSNPAKYISLNSVVDPLELIDDAEGAYSLEKCPADSLSEANQTPNNVGERVTSLSDKPLSCNELSSTNGTEDELPLANPKEPHDLPSKGEELQTTARSSEDRVSPLDKVAGREPEGEFLLDPVLPVESPHGNTSGGPSDGCARPQELRADTKAESGEAVNLGKVSQSDAAPANAELSENSGGKLHKENTEAVTSAESREVSSVSHPAEEKKESYQTCGAELLHTSEVAWLETNAPEDDGPSGGEVIESQDLPMDEEDGVEESVEWESIDLALSDSSDTDGESRNVDLEQEGEELPEESSMSGERDTDSVRGTASPAENLFASVTSPATVPEYQTELASTEEQSIVSPTSSASLNQKDLVEGFCLLQEDAADGREENNLDLASSVSPQESSVHQTDPDAVGELPGNQEASTEPTKLHIFLNRMDLIEDISQDDIHLGDSSPLQTDEGCQVQNSMSTQGEATGNKEDSILSVQNLAPAKEMVLIQGSCVPPKEEGIHLVETAQLPGSPDHQTADEAAELVRNQEVSSTSATTTALLQPVDLAEDSCISQKKEAHCLDDTFPLQANEAVQKQHSTPILEEQKTRETELLNGSQDGKEFQSLEADNQGFDLNTEDGKYCVKDENIGASSATQAVTSDDKINQVAVTVNEDIKSILCKLIEAVSAMTVVESEETCSQETSSLNWISSVTLECVTPPDSDDENPTADQPARTDQNWVVDEDLEQHSILAHQERAISQRQELYRSALHENMRHDEVNTFERRTLQETELASLAQGVFPSSSCTDWSMTSATSLLCTSPLVKMATPKEGDPTASMLCETEVRQASRKASMSEGEDQFSEACVETLPCVPAEHQTACSSEEPDSVVDGDTREGPAESEDVRLGDARQSLEDSEDALLEVRTKSLGSPEGTVASERAHLPARASSVNKDWEDESFAADVDQEHVGSSYHSNKAGTSCTRATVVPETGAATYISDFSPEEVIHESGDWMYLEETERFKEGDRSLDTSNNPGPLKDYVNFSVTKKHKEKTRTFHSSKRHESSRGALGLISSLNRTWRTLSDPTQNTLDMECLRFHYKVKQILRKPQLPTSTDTFAKELSPPVIAEALPLRKVPETPPLTPTPRSTSPLLITIVNPGPRYSISHRYSRRSQHRDAFEPPPLASSQESYSKAARCKSQGQSSVVPFHLNKLTYKNKLKDSRGDISVIMDEFAEFSRVMTLEDRSTSNKGQEQNTTSEDAPEKRSSSLPNRTASYEHLFTELCNTLHFRLKNVAQEACKKTYAFYLMETNDDPFFGRVKNLLKKRGHTEMEPQLFCKANDMETERLMVIIRNEDIFQHIHKIPCLLRLKRFPNVTFAGVDNPEDILDHIYQELFHSGGFVMSDDKVLEMMTIGELKEVVKTLEKLNGLGRWRWLLHYKEMKKLREDARVDSAAHTKESLLKSCQGANITEALHYHQCDSRAAVRAEHLKCLLNLQVQHISQRFAVFLTEKPSTSREALENKGILALDVNTFIATAEDMAAPFRTSSYW